MNENYKHPDKDQLISSIQPKKLVGYFGGDINEIKQWSELSSKQELINTIKAFEHEGLNEYVGILKESLLTKRD